MPFPTSFFLLFPCRNRRHEAARDDVVPLFLGSFGTLDSLAAALQVATGMPRILNSAKKSGKTSLRTAMWSSLLLRASKADAGLSEVS
eukprot:CAMPEP_0174913578 /NCGR_PEP_ID=MMETSP0167-20121228/80392_1 /TAXON_ID=38298 /ORGANISM="Rhodella maculata, Strain CCMP736" /LENGTH=87 /DNA_ID=CAMNT_0016158301 /DNA_START=803 /DNA_END=1063 /DNA_ORIENTATION=+